MLFRSDKVLSKGDVLMVMTDLSPLTLILGRTVLLNEPFQVLHNQRIGKFRFKKPEAWDPAFFAELMNDDRIRRKVIREATGTTVRHTSPERIKSGAVVRPPPDEQHQITRSIEVLVADLQSVREEGHKLHSLRSGMMSDLLNGFVRAPESLFATEARA